MKSWPEIERWIKQIRGGLKQKMEGKVVAELGQARIDVIVEIGIEIEVKDEVQLLVGQGF